MGHKQHDTKEGHQITTPTALGGLIMHQDFTDQNSLSLEMLAGNIQMGNEDLSSALPSPSGLEEKLHQFLLKRSLKCSGNDATQCV
jgi:hypothetical protein